MIRKANQNPEDTASSLAARKLGQHRRWLLEVAWMAYMAFTIVGYPWLGISVLLPSILLSGLATWLYHYKIGLLTTVLTTLYNALAMMHNLDSLQGWRPSLEPGGIATQLLAVLVITIVKNNCNKTLALATLTERHIQERDEELREITEYMTNHSEAESAQISQKLCNIVDYQLTGLFYHSETLMNFLAYTEAPQTDKAAMLVEIARQNIEQIENLTQRLSPRTIMEFGIEKALRKMCAYLEQSAGTRFAIAINERCKEIPDKTTLSIYRIAHEAVTNALRHGKASHVDIQLEFVDKVFSLAVINDGLPLPPTPPAGVGVQLMRHRAETIDATVEYTQDNSGRTRFTCISNQNTNPE